MSLRVLVAEGLGTLLLLAVVVGSGIMGETLADGATALALLANAVATGLALAVLIFLFAPISGAHFNPAVTLAFCLDGGCAWRAAPMIIAAQVIGGVLGVWLAHGMFAEPVWQVGAVVRAGPHIVLSEWVATFGLVLVILAGVRVRATAVPWLVGAYIAAAYWFTASTSFANPAVTLARAVTDTFAGIAPAHVPGFLAAQATGALAAVGLARWLYASPTAAASQEAPRPAA